MPLLSEVIEMDPAHSADFILKSIAALIGIIVLLYFLGVIGWVIGILGTMLRNAVRLGFLLWRRYLSWASWPVFLALVIGLIATGLYAIDTYPAVAILSGAVATLMGLIACLAYIYLDLEQYEVERGYKAIHNPLKGQVQARDLARYGHQVGICFLAVAAISMILGFALLNQGLYWSIGYTWFVHENTATFADFLVYALLNLYRIIDLLDLADQHRLVRLAHVRPAAWPASVLLTAFKTFFTFVLLQQIFASVRKGKLLSETIVDFFSPHRPIHERARQALPQYGVVALNPLLNSLRSGPTLTRDQREALAQIVADIGPAATPWLLHYLRDPNEQVRTIAVSSLGHLQSLESLPYLALLEADPSEMVRMSLVEALGSIVKPGARAVRKRHWFLAWRSPSARSLWRWKRQKISRLGSDPVIWVVNQLRRTLADASPIVRTLAARTLGGMGKAATPAVPQLLPMLADVDDIVRQQVAEALKGIGADPATTVQALLPLLRDPSPRVKAAAAETLGTFQEQAEQVLPALIPLLQDRDELVRQKVAETLGQAGSLSGSSTATLTAGLHSSDALVRARTAEALGNIGTAAETVGPALVQALQDDNDRVRAKAVKALGKIGPGVADAALPNLVQALRDPDTWVQALAAEALGEMGEAADQAVPALIRSLQHPNAQVRFHAAESLGKLGPSAESAVPALERTCHDDDAGVRAQAVRALGEVGSPLGQNTLRQACRDSDFQVRLAAVSACGLIQDCQDATIEVITGMLADSNDEVKVQAARVLAKTRGAEPGLVARLTSLVLEDDNVWVQVQAAGILGSLGTAAAAAGPGLLHAVMIQESDVREAALRALVQIQSPEAPTAFIIGLKDEVPDIRKVASAGWRKASTLPEEALPGLVNALQDPETQVRANAAFALNRLEVLPEQAIPLLLECTNNPNDELRLNSVLALQKVRRKDVEEIMDLLIKDPTPRIRLIAAGFLLTADVNNSLAQDVVTQALSDDSIQLRKAALGLLRTLAAGALFSLPMLQERLQKENDSQMVEELRDLITSFDGTPSTGQAPLPTASPGSAAPVPNA